MSIDLNRATIIGRLTRDPEVRTTTNGKTVASITVVTNMVWTDQSGQKQEKPEFHNCVLWGRLGDIAGQYLNKGKRVYVEGRIETRDWVGQDGAKKYRTELVASNMIMLDGGSGGQANSQGFGSSQSGDVPLPDEGAGDQEIKVEDIPF